MPATTDLFLFFLPVITGSLSLITSSSIIWKILRSNTKLSSPYSRLIFGLCFYDIISSIANALSAVPSPPSPYGTEVWGAFGNETTCRIQGFMFTLSSSSTPFYNLSLCIYYLCLIRYSMRDERFGKHIEPFLHIIPLLYSLTISTYLLANDNYHFNGTVCWITQSSPENLPFIRTFGTITIGGPILLIFVAVIGLMGLITFTVWSQENRMNQYRFELGTAANGNPRSSMMNGTPSRRRLASENRIRAVQTQANLFAFAFLLTFTFPVLYRFMVGVLGVTPPPDAIVWLTRGLYPLQGVFNLFAHMHPQVVTTRRNDRDLSYFQAFCVAFKTYEEGLDRRTRLNSTTATRSSTTRSGVSAPGGGLLSSRASRRSSRHLSSISNRQPPPTSTPNRRGNEEETRRFSRLFSSPRTPASMDGSRLSTLVGDDGDSTPLKYSPTTPNQQETSLQNVPDRSTTPDSQRSRPGGDQENENVGNAEESPPPSSSSSSLWSS